VHIGSVQQLPSAVAAASLLLALMVPALPRSYSSLLLRSCHCCSYGADTMAYAMAVGMGGAPSCADAALATLKELVTSAPSYR